MLCCFIIDKLMRAIFIILLIVLMILWLVLCIETTRQIVDVQNRLGSRGSGHIPHTDGFGSNNNGDPEKRFLTSLYSQLQIQGLSPSTSTSITPMITRSLLPRLFILAIFNTLIEELIAFIAIISLLLMNKHRYDHNKDNGHHHHYHHHHHRSRSSSHQWFRTSLTLLTIIWFIEQYRIGDLIYYHHNFDEQTTIVDQWNVQRMILTAHMIHFIIIIFGSIISLMFQQTINESKIIKTMAASINTSTAATVAASTINTIHSDRLLSTSSSSSTTLSDIEANRLQSKQQQQQQISKQERRKQKQQKNNMTFKTNFAKNMNIEQQQMDLNLQPTTSTSIISTNNGNSGSSIKTIGDRFKKPCHWMRSTFIIHNNNNNHLKAKNNKSSSSSSNNNNNMAINDQNNNNDNGNLDHQQSDNDIDDNQGRGSKASTAIVMDRLIE